MDEPIVEVPQENGAVDVVLDSLKQPQQAVEYAPAEVQNLIPAIASNENELYPSYLDDTTRKTGPDILKEMGSVVVEEYKQDLLSRAEWEENVASYLKLFTAFMPPKNTPWPGASNVCLPLLAIACLQFHARAIDALIPPKDIANVFPTSDEDIPRADRVQKHFNYQLLYEMPGFEDGMDRSLLQLPVIGDILRKTFYDGLAGTNRSVYVSAMDVVWDYYAQTFEEAKRVTHILRLNKNDIRKRVRSGIFREEAWDFGPGTMEEKSPIKEASDNIQGIQEPGIETDKPRIFLEQHRTWDLDGDGIAEDYVITVDLETEMPVRMTSRTYTDAFGKEQVIDYFTNYEFFPNPEGSYGLGFGILIRHLNESADGIINEIIDAGSLANMQGGFILERSGIKTGDLSFKRGEYKPVKANTDDIKKAIFTFDFRGPNQTLYSVLGLLYEYSKLVSSISETMTGQLPSSDTPASTVMALIEEGRKVFSSIHKRIHRSFKKELKKLFRLNSIFLDERKYFKVLGDNKMPDPQSQNIPIGKADYSDTLDIVPVSDPAILSRAEKVMKAQMIVQDIRTNPLTANNQQANFVATKRYYEALEVPNLEELLQPPPPPPDLPPEIENANFFKEQPATVLPQQDHAWHYQIHENFLANEPLFSNELTPEGRKLAEQHRLETIAALYIQTKDQEIQMAQQAAGMGMPPGMIPGGMQGGNNNPGRMAGMVPNAPNQGINPGGPRI